MSGVSSKLSSLVAKVFAACLALACLAVLQPQPADAAEPCFFGKDAFTIQSKLSGSQEGTITEHVSECGRRRVEIQKSKVSFMGVVQEEDKRTIFEAANIIVVDGKTGAITKTKNPMYDSVVESLDGRTGVELGREMMQRMGGKPTGKTGSYAGQDCEYWEIPGAGSTTCITSWGATLYMKTDTMGLTMEREAVSVKLGDGGPPSAYQYDESKAVQQPDPMKLLEQLRQGQQP